MRSWPLFAVALLVAPLGASAPSDGWRAASLELDGPTSVEASLGSLVVETGADDGRVALDATELWAGSKTFLGYNVSGQSKFFPTTSPAFAPLPYEQARLSGHAKEPSMLIVTPLLNGERPTIQWTTGHGVVEPSKECAKDDMPPFREGVCLYGGDHQTALGRVHSTEDSFEATIVGSFQVRLWGWEGQGAWKHGEYDFSSGESEYPLATGDHLREATWEFWQVDGTLRITSFGTPRDLVVGAMTLVPMGEVALHASNRSADLEPASKVSVRFEPDAAVVSGLAGNGAQAASSPASAFVGSGQGWDGLSWPLAILGGVLLAIVGLVAWRALRPSDPVLRALHAKDPIKAAKLAAAAGPSRSPEEAVTRAVAFLQAGELGPAERELNAYALPDADLKFILACIRARQGRDQEARVLLQASLAQQPAYAGEVAFNPDLLRISSTDAKGPALREGYS